MAIFTDHLSPRLGPNLVPWLALLGFSMVASACHEERAAAGKKAALKPSVPPPTRELAEVVPAHKGWIGVVVPRASVDVAARHTGRLEAVDVRPGDTVTAGQRLARLDTRSLDQEVRMAEADLTAARAEHERATADAEREAGRYQRRLAAADVVSREEQEAAAADARAAAAMRDAGGAQVAQRQARLDDLRQRRTEAELRAPFSGRVAARYFDTGATVDAGTSVVRLLRDDALVVRFAVPPSGLEALAEGLRVRVLDTDGQPVANATVVQVAPELDIPSQMVFAEAIPAATQDDAANATTLRAGGGVWVVPCRETSD